MPALRPLATKFTCAAALWAVLTSAGWSGETQSRPSIPHAHAAASQRTALAATATSVSLRDGNKSFRAARRHIAATPKPHKTRSSAATAETAGIPAALVQLGPGQRHVLTVDASARRMLLWRQQAAGSVRLVRSMPIALGAGGLDKQREGDRRTPLGWYRVVGLRQTPALPPDYGPVAMVLNYPNELDRTLGRTGSDIWLHGSPDPSQSAPQRSSRGCIVLRNADLLALQRLLGDERPMVLITRDLPRASEAQHSADRRAVRGWLSAWQRASLRGQADALQRLYSPGAYAERQHVPPPVTLSELSIVVTDRNTWVLDFNAGNGAEQRRHTQYWQRTEGEWKIVAEGTSG